MTTVRFPHEQAFNSFCSNSLASPPRSTAIGTDHAGLMRVTFTFGFLLSILTSVSVAQVGDGSGLWEWTPLATHHEAIVEISAGGGSGTGVLISVDKSKPVKSGYEGYCLTAWHVVQDDLESDTVRVRFRNGKGAKGCRVIECDEDKDVAIVWTWVPAGVVPAKLAEKPIERGDKLEFAGLGGGSKLEGVIRHFSATASSPSTLEKIFADVPLLPGDSGGPVFNADNEVVGIISGGWFWWNSGVKSETGTHVRTTWPARASNIGPIQNLMAKMNQEELTETVDDVVRY